MKRQRDPEPRRGVFKTPLGWCAVAWEGKRLQALVLPRANALSALRALPEVRGLRRKDFPVPSRFSREIRRALAGLPFKVPPLDLRSLTPFQRAVLRAASTVPHGETRSYAWVAAHCGCPKGARAVGGALHRNPLPLFIPCHRVTASHGRLGGFGAGLAMKRRLLRLENVDAL